MTGTASTRLVRIFRRIVALRWWIVGFYALLLPPAIVMALRVGHDNSLDRLIVQSDPDYIANKAFEEVFGKGEYILLLAEADDPFAPEAMGRIAEIEAALGAIPGVEPSSALSAFRQAKGGFASSSAGVAPAADAEAMRRFATGTTLFRDQGLIGEKLFAIPVVLHAESSEALRGMLADVDAAIAPFQKEPAPLSALRKIGGPYVNAYLDRETARATARFMPIFALLLLGLNLALYRSFRTLLVFVITMGASVALTVAYVGATGGVLTIVSPLVPMTVLITCTATLVYIQSRFVDHPGEDSIDDHQLFALANKFTACTASLFATAVGFAALAVSQIRPIRELGIWVAVGLLMTWVIVFTLFPALQKILRTPTQHQRRTAGAQMHRIADWLPEFTYRWRWPLVVGSLAASGCGAVAIFGFPGLLEPMPLQTEGISYISASSDLYKDTKRFERVIAGLSVTEVWVRGPAAALTDPEALRGLDRFGEALRREPGIGSTAGMTTVLRMLRYVGGGPDTFPDDPAEAASLAVQLELLRPTTPVLQGFVDPALSQTHIAVISRAGGFEAFQELAAQIRGTWERTAHAHPALRGFRIDTVGSGPLQAKIASHLVPTLVESFGITAAIIFVAFLLVFRSGPARLMAMIPSLFAILVMFGVMRVTGMALNVATILIASTVLGTSENDQIHFFWHFLEKRQGGGSVDASLRHTIQISGRAIVFATIINAGGFLAFVFADLPPMRQFGTLTALAFGLSMIADFTALPAALWIIYRARPGTK